MDDRKDFESKKLENASSMASDEGLRQKALDLITHADKYGFSYQWSWFGVPIIQLTDDIVVLQEIIWRTRPTLIIETGVARGGSLIFFAAMLKLLGEGRVLGVDIDIRPHNRASVEDHFLADRISLLEGSSVGGGLVNKVKAKIRPDDRVMVVLDSDHTHDHVLEELRLYGDLVTPGCYLVACDTVVEQIPAQEHRPRHWGPGDNPLTAVRAYLEEKKNFSIDEQIDNKLLLSSNPSGYLVRND